eukprot:762804-Hanusia_phi.AAC.3
MRAYRYKGAKVVIREGERVLEWTEMEPVVIYKQAKKFVVSRRMRQTGMPEYHLDRTLSR